MGLRRGTKTVATTHNHVEKQIPPQKKTLKIITLLLLIGYIVIVCCTILCMFETFYNKNMENSEVFQVFDPAYIRSTGFLESCELA